MTKIYLLLRPEFLMIGKSKESKEGNSYYLDCFEKESQKGIGTLVNGDELKRRQNCSWHDFASFHTNERDLPIVLYHTI